MLAKVILRQVAASSANFAELANTSGQNSHAGANGGAVAFRAYKFKEHAMIRILGAIDEQRGRFTDIEDGYVHVAIIVHVAKGSAAAARQRNLSLARGRGDVLKGAVSKIAAEFFVAAELRKLVDVQVNVSRHEEIDMSVRFEKKLKEIPNEQREQATGGLVKQR